LEVEITNSMATHLKPPACSHLWFEYMVGHMRDLEKEPSFEN